MTVYSRMVYPFGGDPLGRCYAKLPFGLVHGVFESLVPGIGTWSLFWVIEEVEAGIALVLTDLQCLEGRKGDASRWTHELVFRLAGA